MVKQEINQIEDLYGFSELCTEEMYSTNGGTIDTSGLGHCDGTPPDVAKENEKGEQSKISYYESSHNNSGSNGSK